jgi:uncharacterized protein
VEILSVSEDNNKPMEPRISVITIGADNVAAMQHFYTDILGWEPVAANKDIVFYQLNGFLLSICEHTSLAEFIGVSAEGSGFRRTTIGYNVHEEWEVLKLYEQLKDKVKVLKAPTVAPFGGMFFYFADIEGNIIEIACNPFVVFSSSNDVVSHKPIDDL